MSSFPFGRSSFPSTPENKFKDKWHKLVPGQPSWTVVADLAKDAYSHIHYDSEQARSISVREKPHASSRSLMDFGSRGTSATASDKSATRSHRCSHGRSLHTF